VLNALHGRRSRNTHMDKSLMLATPIARLTAFWVDLAILLVSVPGSEAVASGPSHAAQLGRDHQRARLGSE